MNLPTLLQPIQRSLFWKTLVRFSNNTYLLVSLILLPLFLISPLTDGFFSTCAKTKCEEVANGEPIVVSVELADEEKIELLVTSSDRFYYPIYSLLNGFQTEVSAEFDIDRHGKPKNIRVLAATSNLKKSFEREAKKWLQSRNYALPEGSSLSFPIEGAKLTVPFKLINPDGTDLEIVYEVEYWRIIYSIVGYLAVSFFIVGGVYKNLVQWLSDTCIPCGALLGLLFLNDAIYVGITTNFTSLAEALLMFLSFGAIAAIASFYADDRPRDYNLTPFKYFLLAILMLELHFGIQEEIGLSILSALVDPTFFTDAIPYRIQNPEWLYLEKTFLWNTSVLANFNGISLLIFSLIFFFGVLHHNKNKDISIFVQGGLFSAGLTIALTMFLWFQNFSAIQEDYVNLLDIAHIGSTGLTYLAMTFLIVHLISLRNDNGAIPNWRRMNFYFIEAMTFFLFFVYAPVSLSELGISYDEDQESTKKIEGLENEIEELKEILEQNNLKLNSPES